eukprot:7252226-Prymnesium_polylepis.1
MALMRRRRLLGCSVFALRLRRPRCRPRYVRTSTRTASRITTCRSLAISSMPAPRTTARLRHRRAGPVERCALFDTGAAVMPPLASCPCSR